MRVRLDYFDQNESLPPCYPAREPSSVFFRLLTAENGRCSAWMRLPNTRESHMIISSSDHAGPGTRSAARRRRRSSFCWSTMVQNWERDSMSRSSNTWHGGWSETS